MLPFRLAHRQGWLMARTRPHASLFILLSLLAIVRSPNLSAQVDPLGRSILFVRGGDGTGGLGNGSVAQRTEHLSDIGNLATNFGNHGWGQLAQFLRSEGFSTTQWIETNGSLTPARLAPHRIVVFGSNNRAYTAAEVQALHDYVDSGGSALFISDANWGPNWGAAPSSDNQFLVRYGIEMLQDSANGVITPDTSRFVVPDHPIIAGYARAGDELQSFSGEGVSFQRLGRPALGYTNFAIVNAQGYVVRENTVNNAAGPTRPADSRDASVSLAVRNRSKVLCLFDRNTWFNANGAGTSISGPGNVFLAQHVFRYLAGCEANTRSLGTGCAIDPTPPQLLSDSPAELGQPLQIGLRDAPPLAPTVLLFSAAPSSPFVVDGCTIYPNATFLVSAIAPATSNLGRWNLSFGIPESSSIAGATVTVQVVIVTLGGPLFGAAELTNGLEVTVGL